MIRKKEMKVYAMCRMFYCRLKVLFTLQRGTTLSWKQDDYVQSSYLCNSKCKDCVDKEKLT